METEKNQEQDLVKEEGVFLNSLQRNNKQIRADRAKTIAEDTEMLYKREIEDLEVKIKRMKREREGMLDLSPTNAQNLVLASDFKAEIFVKKDIELGSSIRNAEILLEISRERYNYLFGTKK